MAKRGLLVGVADDSSYVPPPIRSVVWGTFANLEQPQCCRYVGSNRIAEALDQVVSAETSPPRGRRREAMLALAAAVVTVVASGTVWLIGDPASSGVSAEIAQSAVPAGVPSSAGPSPASDPGPPT